MNLVLGIQVFHCPFQVPGSCPADVPVILKRMEERLTSLETNQLEAQKERKEAEKERKEAEKERKESKTKIEELTAQVWHAHR